MLVQDQRNIRQRLEDTIEQAWRISRCRSIVVARRDGLVIVHRVEQGRDPNLAAAMAAATIGSAATAARELGQGTVEHVAVECSKGTTLALDAGPEAVIIALYDKDVNVELALRELARTAAAIDRILLELTSHLA